MAEVWDDWKQSSRLLAERIKNDSRSCILSTDAKFYAVEDRSEVRFGWPFGRGDRHKCIGIIQEKKEADGIQLLLHLDPKAELVYDPAEFPHGNGRPFRLSCSSKNKSDSDRGEILLTQDRFPDQLFSWIACAIRHTASERKPQTILSADVLAAILSPLHQIVCVIAFGNIRQYRRKRSGGEGEGLLFACNRTKAPSTKMVFAAKNTALTDEVAHLSI